MPVNCEACTACICTVKQMLIATNGITEFSQHNTQFGHMVTQFTTLGSMSTWKGLLCICLSPFIALVTTDSDQDYVHAKQPYSASEAGA